MRPIVCTLSLTLGLCCVIASQACAELTTADNQRLAAVAAAYKTAGEKFAAQDYEAAGKALREAQTLLVEAVEKGSPDVRVKADAAHASIKKAAALLELEGVRVPPVDLDQVVNAKAKQPEMKKPDPKPAPTKPKPPAPEPTPAPTPPPAPGTVSFVKEVAPILVNHCARCHIAGNRGNFSMSSYTVLMKGPPEGVVVFPGDVVASRLIETIVTGDMPRGGAKVPPAQLETLKKWVTQGAKFDGPTPDAPLTSLVKPGDSPAMAPTEPLQVKRATGKETVSFARQVAPLLLENCNGCHIDAMQTRGGLRMDTVAQLMRGGDSGAVIVPGKPDESLIIQKLRGQSGDRMPAGGRPAFSEDKIQLISTWIREGATLDEGNADQPLRVLAAQAWAKKATPEELSAKRLELATKNWNLGNPGAEMKTVESEHFVVLGDVSQATLEMVSKASEGVIKEVTTVSRPAGKEEPFRGRTTIYVFPKRYAYSEFGRMIETRGLPNDWTGHWRFDGVDAYIAMVVTSDETPDSLHSRLSGLLTSQAVAQFGDVPRWVAEGIGRMTAAREGGKQGPALQWDAELPRALNSIQKPEEFLDGKLPPEQADLVAYGMGKFMYDKANRRGTDRMLKALVEGKSLKEAVAIGFNATPTELVNSYAVWQRGQLARKR